MKKSVGGHLIQGMESQAPGKLDSKLLLRSHKTLEATIFSQKLTCMDEAQEIVEWFRIDPLCWYSYGLIAFGLSHSLFRMKRSYHFLGIHETLKHVNNLDPFASVTSWPVLRTYYCRPSYNSCLADCFNCYWYVIPCPNIKHPHCMAIYVFQSPTFTLVS